jgi:hypothetical protein
MTPSKRITADDRPRHAKRVTKIIPVDCKILQFPGDQLSKHVLKKGESFGGRTINISKSGLLINSDFELDKKTLVEVTLSLNPSGKPKIHLSVEVAWAKRNAFVIYGRWAMGMRIVEADEADLDALDEFFHGEE